MDVFFFLKKDLFSELEILEFCEQESRKEYSAEEPSQQFETQRFENQNITEPKSTISKLTQGIKTGKSSNRNRKSK